MGLTPPPDVSGSTPPGGFETFTESCIVYSLRLHFFPIRQMTKSQLEFFRMLDQKIDAVSVIF